MTRLPAYYKGYEAFGSFEYKNGVYHIPGNPFEKHTLQFKEYESGYNDAYRDNLRNIQNA